MRNPFKTLASTSQPSTLHRLMASALLVCASGLTQADPLAGGYIGLNIGQAKLADQCNQEDLDSVGFIGSCKDTDTTWSITGGARLTDKFAIEIGYHQLGAYPFEGTADVTSQPLSFSGSVEVSAVTLAGVATIPITDSFSLHGKLGANFWSLDTNAQIAGVVSISSSENGIGLYGALGAAYYFTQHVGLQAQYEYFPRIGKEDTTGKDDVHVLSAGVVFKF